jgi:hypothetical protein
VFTTRLQEPVAILNVVIHPDELKTASDVVDILLVVLFFSSHNAIEAFYDFAVDLSGVLFDPFMLFA